MRSRAFVLVLVALVAFPILAFSAPASVRPGLGVVIALNLDESSETASLITNILGASLEVPFAGGFAFEPGADLYWAYYELSARGRAVPTEVSDRMAFVLGLLLDLPFTYTVPLGGHFRLAFGLGLALNARVGFLADKSVTNDELMAINRYFWEVGRFAMPSTLLRIEYRLTERFDFGFAARALWPLFNLWTAEELPFLDQGIFGGSLVIRYRMR